MATRESLPRTKVESYLNQYLTNLPSILSYFSISDVLVFFFFQAEDGIRDVAVTGVQTCALPISRSDLCRRLFCPRPRRRACRPRRRSSRTIRRRREVLEQGRQGSARASAHSRRTFGSPLTRVYPRSEEHTSELQSRLHLVCRLLLETTNYNTLYL